MESIYHHTSFNVLKSIVTDTGLNFRASKYSNYINGEYEWIKDKAIQEMCEEQGEPFDSDPKEHNPDVFSMCLHDKRGKGRKTAMKRVYDKCMVGPDNYQEDLSVCTSCLKQEEFE